MDLLYQFRPISVQETAKITCKDHLQFLVDSFGRKRRDMGTAITADCRVARLDFGKTFSQSKKLFFLPHNFGHMKRSRERAWIFGNHRSYFVKKFLFLLKYFLFSYQHENTFSNPKWAWINVNYLSYFVNFSFLTQKIPFFIYNQI